MLHMLRPYLGSHPQMQSGQLFELEVVSLVIWAGHAAKILVRAEIPIPTAKISPRGRMPTMDYGGDPATNTLLVPWELDGQDVQDSHIRGNALRVN